MVVTGRMVFWGKGTVAGSYRGWNFLKTSVTKMDKNALFSVVTGRMVFLGKVFKRNIDLCFGALRLVTDRLVFMGKKSVFKV